jgi:hypothetical protein
LQNSAAFVQGMSSTGFDVPLNFEGFGTFRRSSSPCVTSVRSMRKASTFTRRVGRSSSFPFSLPIRNSPAGMRTISTPDLVVIVLRSFGGSGAGPSTSDASQAASRTSASARLT